MFEHNKIVSFVIAIACAATAGACSSDSSGDDNVDASSEAGDSNVGGRAGSGGSGGFGGKGGSGGSKVGGAGGQDASPDVDAEPVDAEPEAEPDAKTDGEPDVVPDVELDVVPDVELDVVPDGEPDVVPDGEPDVVPDGEPDVVPDVVPDTPPPYACNLNGFTATHQKTTLMTSSTGNRSWGYLGMSNNKEAPFEAITFRIRAAAATVPPTGTFTITSADTSLATCTTCILGFRGCSVKHQSISYETVYMPRVGSKYTIEQTGELGERFKVKLDGIEFQEVEIGDNKETTPVVGAKGWCIEDSQLDAEVTPPGAVDLPKPASLSCEYPDPPYAFDGPFDGQTFPAPGTVPPLVWPGAYFNDQQVGLDLAKFRCDHPEIKTLFIVVGAGWCSACAQFMTNTFCSPGGLEKQLHALNAEMLYVWGEAAKPGTIALNEYANKRVSYYGCKGGYRFSDIDSNAEARVIFESHLVYALPSVLAIRTSDMKLTHVQDPNALHWMDFVAIATANNQ